MYPKREIASREISKRFGRLQSEKREDQRPVVSHIVADEVGAEFQVVSLEMPRVVVVNLVLRHVAAILVRVGIDGQRPADRVIRASNKVQTVTEMRRLPRSHSER